MDFSKIDIMSSISPLFEGQLGLVLLTGVLLLGLVLSWPSPKRKRSRPKTRSPWQSQSAKSDIATQQLLAIANVPFETQAMLNKEEARLLPLLDQIVADHGNGARLLCQCALGELIRPCRNATENTSAAFRAINSKRVDFAIVNRGGHLQVAIEYQGTGHHQKAAFLRDAVKREAVRKSGAAFVELTPDMSHARIERDIHSALGTPTDVTPLPSRRSHAASRP